MSGRIRRGWSARPSEASRSSRTGCNPDCRPRYRRRSMRKSPATIGASAHRAQDSLRSGVSALRTQFPPPDRRHGPCMRYVPRSFPPSSLRAARPAPAATVRCAARSLRLSACSALARSARPRVRVQRLRPCTSFLARPPQRTAYSRGTFQRPCAAHHRRFPHPHSPIACGLRIAGVVWARGAIAATLHNVPFCARRPSPPGPCRGHQHGNLHAPVRSPQNTHYAKWPPALRAAKVCLRQVAYGRFVTCVGLRVGWPAGLHRRHRHALERAARFFLSRCSCFTTVHRIVSHTAVAHRLISRASLAPSPRA